MAWLTPQADPVRRVAIVPHGRALGVMQQLPVEERYNMSKADLLARLDVMFTSESLVIGEIATGAENDLVQATRLARRMITCWGMSALGPVAFDSRSSRAFSGRDPPSRRRRSPTGRRRHARASVAGGPGAQ
jgi:cell division protease FtsH